MRFRPNHHKLFAHAHLMRFASVYLVQPLLLILFLSLNVFSQIQPTTTAEFEDLATDLVTLKSPQERESLLSKKRNLMTPDLRKALIRQGNTQLLEGRYATAFDIYGLAQNIAEQIGDKEGIAAAALDIGTVYYFQANYPAALEHYRKARELFTEVTNDYESAKALSGLALIYKETRRDAEALAALQQALKEFTSLGDKQEIADTLNTIGTIYYGQGDYTAAAESFLKSSEANSNAEGLVRLADALYMQGDYSQALNYYKQSLARVSDRGLGATIASLNGAANTAYYLGNYDEALQFYERNVELQKTQPDKLGLALSLKGIGNVHRSRGDYAAALESYFSSLRISEQIKAPTGTTLGSIGLVRALQGDYVRALDYYNRALNEFEATANTVEMARVLSLIGNVYYAQANYNSAIESYQRALALRVNIDDKSGQGDVLAGMGSTFVRQKNFSDGLDTYHKALGLFESIGNKDSIAEVLTRVSHAFLLQGDYAKALSAADSAVAMARQLDKPDLLWYAQMLKGKAYQKLDQGTPAYQAITEAVRIVESLRSRPAVGADEHDSTLPYLSAVDLLLDQHRPGEAFDYAERAKVQGLLDLLRNSNSTPRKGLSPAESIEQQRLAGNVITLELQLDRELQLRTSTETRRSGLRERLHQAQAAYAEFRQKLFVAHPGLKGQQGELAPLKLDDIRSLIWDTSTALLEFTITENNTYLFVLTAEKVSDNASRAKRRAEINLKVYPLEIRNNELTSRVSEFERKLASRADDFHEAARELYDLLIEPAGDQIALKTKLVIVPDGILWRLPFEALQPTEDHYVVDQMEVSYAPSLSALREMRKQKVPSRLRSSFVAFGNPLLSKTFKDRVELAYADTKLESSQQHEEEIKRLAVTYGSARSRVWVGFEATAERLQLEAPRAGILHFATPVLLDNVSPMSSFIGLSVQAGKRGEGFLQMREIMNLYTAAEMVVLSDAQLKGDFNGAATPGASWSWFVAGSPSIMLNRWKIEQAAESKFMSQFYSFIRPNSGTKVSKGNALHRSLMSLRRSPEFQHPYYWASFRIIGDAR